MEQNRLNSFWVTLSAPFEGCFFQRIHCLQLCSAFNYLEIERNL